MSFEELTNGLFSEDELETIVDEEAFDLAYSEIEMVVDHLLQDHKVYFHIVAMALEEMADNFQRIMEVDDDDEE